MLGKAASDDEVKVRGSHFVGRLAYGERENVPRLRALFCTAEGTLVSRTFFIYVQRLPCCLGCVVCVDCSAPSSEPTSASDNALSYIMVPPCLRDPSQRLFDEFGQALKACSDSTSGSNR